MSPSFSNFLSIVVDYAWGLPLVFLLIGGGFYLLTVSKLLPLRGFAHAFALITGKFKHQAKSAEGQISHFQGLTNALAATIGLGNIAGVAVAITQGGPGAIFWMWLAGIIGMNTKFFECSLSLMHRGHDFRGEVQGGPMYVIENALSKKFRPLAYMFAICGMVGTMALFQVNQLAEYSLDQFGTPKLMVGIICAVIVAMIMVGGIRRLAKVTETLVPSMCLFYVICCSVIIIMNFERVPGIFVSIFSEAFTGRSMLGGAMGVAIIEVMKVGVKRAAFSNEAGMGTAPMAHGNVKTPEPISEGLVAMLGPFFDTIIVCTMTALVILSTTDPADYVGLSGILLTTKAFENSLPGFGAHFLGIAILLFSVTTMIGMANYNQKCWNYLFKGRWGMGRNAFIFFFCATVVFGSVSSLTDVVNIIDIGFAMMAVPNMITTIILARSVERALEKYITNYVKVNN